MTAGGASQRLERGISNETSTPSTRPHPVLGALEKSSATTWTRALPGAISCPVSRALPGAVSISRVTKGSTT